MTEGTSNLSRTNRTAIFLQDECLKHRFIRSRDTSDIVERPERLRAVKTGLAAAISRVGEFVSTTDGSSTGKLGGLRGESVPVSLDSGTDKLAEALERLNIASSADVGGAKLRTSSIDIRRTTATVDLLDHQAVKYVHGDIDGDVYLESLIAWARDSQENIAKKGSEIPEGIPPLDLYLCPSSIDAIRGAIGAVCEAVDAVITSTKQPVVSSAQPCERAFVAIRPPGHHCGEDTPCGFCFVNNVAIGAAHAHLNHGIRRIVILDIDLHHGNGTQSIVWQINEETYRQTLESEEFFPGEPPPERPGPQIYYGSLHDVLSFPCEDRKPNLVQAASTSIHGAHGQHIENIHLQCYQSESQFWDVLYPQYLVLLKRAQDFLDNTGGPGDDVMVFMSCGFDACEHEYPFMSRHNRKVPTSFYHRFTRDTCMMADTYAGGRLVSVLEGGYSDRALMSGAMAHLCGLVNMTSETTSSVEWVDEEWWSVENLIKLEKATKSRKGTPRTSLASSDSWLSRTTELLSIFDVKSSGRNSSVPLTSRTLRDRKKPLPNENGAGRTGTTGKDAKKSGKGTPSLASDQVLRTPSSSPDVVQSPPSRPVDEENPTDQPPPSDSAKKLPRVILHVRPPPDTST
ncbi:arginase deacetylase [Phlebopus sp. FC_14]|nr:arginase deacetylase [Phlebopus sp. FC_14]